MPNTPPIEVTMAPEIKKLLDGVWQLASRYNAAVAALAEMREQRNRALAVVDAARAAHDGASVETRRAALERLGAALKVYDEGE